MQSLDVGRGKEGEDVTEGVRGQVWEGDSGGHHGGEGDIAGGLW